MPATISPSASISESHGSQGAGSAQVRRGDRVGGVGVTAADDTDAGGTTVGITAAGITAAGVAAAGVAAAGVAAAEKPRASIATAIRPA
jgi:hypothetical protein